MLSCVYCPNPAGSREHLMNAGLGGLREFKRVTCDTCNKSFARTIDRVIARDLASLNALAGVISRHRGTPVWATCIDDATGYEYVLSGRRSLHQTGPIELPETTTEDGKRRRIAIFSNEEQEREWVRRVEAEGKDFSIVERRIERVYFPRPLWLNAGLSGPESLRAVGRIAMNYLARYFPEVARDASLQPFRDFVLGTSEEHFVRFDFGWNRELPANTYTFGHRVMVGVRSSGEVIGAVSFFGVFELSVSFGSVAPCESAMQTVDIDPVADGFPNDMRELSPAPCTLPIADRAPPLELMEREARTRVRDMKRRIEDRNWNDDAPGLLRRVHEALRLDDYQREGKLSEVLESQDARILNLAAIVCASIAEQAAEARGLPAGLAEFFRTLFDTDERNQLNTAGFCMLVMTRDRIVEGLLDEQGDLTEDRLRLYLEGSIGHRAAYDAFIGALEGVPGLLRRSGGGDETGSASSPEGDRDVVA